MNDPNGLVFDGSQYHMFYQHIPQGGHALVWGHATSENLMDWTHLPVAIPEDELGHIWSGSCVRIPFEGLATELRAFFTYQTPERQCQGMARSQDLGRTWQKYPENPILVEDLRDFRDPKVFVHPVTLEWNMLVASGDCLRRYRSQDLASWEFVSRVGLSGAAPNLLWECPDTFPLPDGRWVLVASHVGSEHGRHLSTPRALVGRWTEDDFVPEGIWAPLNWGPDDYATISWFGVHPPVVIGWMNHWSYARSLPTEGWNGMMTVPRVVTAEPDGTILQRPIKQVAQLRKASLDLLQGDVETESVALDIELGAGELSESVALRISTEADELIRVGYDPVRREAFVDRTSAGVAEFHDGFAREYRAPLLLSADLRVRVLVDRYSVEAFFQDGEVLMTALFFARGEKRVLSLEGSCWQTATVWSLQ